jgi:methionyl-tRNA formyltransferase
MPPDFVFFGSPQLAVLALEELKKVGHLPRAVVCQPDKPAGRGNRLRPPATKIWALDNQLPVLQPRRCREPGFLEEFRRLGAELGLVFAFGQILPPELLELAPCGFINIHPSLLPRWRGAAPVQWTLLSGDRQAGVSIIRVTPRLDDGDILLQQAVEILPEEDAGELSRRLAVLGGRMAAEALEKISTGSLQPRAQDASQVTWARPLDKNDGLIDWSKPAEEICRLVRGTQPWPGAFTRLRGRTLKVFRARALQQPAGARPGQVLEAQGERLVVAAGHEAVALLEVQLEGRRRLSVREFLLGRPLAPGDQLQ